MIYSNIPAIIDRRFFLSCNELISLQNRKRIGSSYVPADRVKKKTQLPLSFLLFGAAPLAGCGNGTTVVVPPAPPAPNQVPVASNDTLSVPIGQASAQVNLIANDRDPDTGQTLTIGQVNGAANSVGQAVTLTYGTLTVTSTGAATYALASTGAAFRALTNGQTVTDTVNYGISDGAGGTSTASVTIAIIGVNDIPVVQNDTITLAATENAATMNVLANDSDADKDSVLSITQVNGSANNVNIATEGTYGSLTVTASGLATYKINTSDIDFLRLTAGQAATERFNLMVSDGVGGAVTQEVVINLAGRNEGPFVPVLRLLSPAPNTYESAELGTGAVDFEGDTFRLVAINGVVGDFSNPNNSFIDDTPFGRFFLSDKNITFTAFQFTPDFIALKQGETADATLRLTYRDSAGNRSESTVVAQVVGINDAPQGSATVSLAQNQTVISGRISDDITDPEGDTITVTAVGFNAANVGRPVIGEAGTLMVNADGSYSYTLDTNSVGYLRASANFRSSDFFNLNLSDGNAPDGSGSLAFSFFGINDAPIARDDAVNVVISSGFQGTSSNLSIFIGSNDQEPDFGDSLTLTKINGVAVNFNTPVRSSNGYFDIIYQGSPFVVNLSITENQPALRRLPVGQTLTDSFTYEISDSSRLTSTATVTVTLSGTAQIGTNANDALQYTGISEYLFGGDGDDRFIASQSFNSIPGLRGDEIDGGDGIDTLVLPSNISQQLLSLFDGTYQEFSSGYTLPLTAPDPATISIRNIENVIGGTSNDIIYGNSANNFLFGNGGNDQLFGLDGDDILVTDYGRLQTMIGGNGDDILYSSRGDGTFQGGEGNDILIFRLNSSGLLLLAPSTAPANFSSTFSGGNGSDIFILGDITFLDIPNYFPAEILITIADFNQSQNDRIDLSDLKDAQGNILDLQDIIDNSRSANGNTTIDLSAFSITNGLGTFALNTDIVLSGVSNITALTTADFIFSNGLDWEALIPAP